jgi:hypothetical protein
MRALILIPLLASAALFADDAELAVVVNPSTALATISSAELRQMALGEKAKWPDGKKVTMVQTPQESPEKASAKSRV